MGGGYASIGIIFGRGPLQLFSQPAAIPASPAARRFARPPARTPQKIGGWLLLPAMGAKLRLRSIGFP
jgi:hypothetical protein